MPIIWPILIYHLSSPDDTNNFYKPFSLCCMTFDGFRKSIHTLIYVGLKMIVFINFTFVSFMQENRNIVRWSPWKLAMLAISHVSISIIKPNDFQCQINFICSFESSTDHFCKLQKNPHSAARLIITLCKANTYCRQQTFSFNIMGIDYYCIYNM